MKLKEVLKGLSLFFIMTCVALPLVLQADVYIKQKSHADAYSIMGKSEPAKDEMTIMWMADDKARIDQGEERSTIIRLDKNVMYMIDHAKMTYAEIPVGGIGDIISQGIEGIDASDEEKAEAKKFMKGFSSMMKPKIEITDTGEKEKIKGWNCRKYIMKMTIMMSTTTSEIWTTEDIKINYEFYRTLGSAMMGGQPGFKEVFEEMKKVKGITVLSSSTSSVMGSEMKRTEELVEAKDRKAPKGIYDLPEGYKKTE